jgi:hypothetical protein
MVIYTHDYDSRFNPTMPVVEIQVFLEAGQNPITLTAIVDTGADASMIPLKYLRRLKAKKRRTKWLTGTTGVREKADLYGIAIQIGRARPIFLEAIGTEQRNEVIVGRDVLNEFVVTLNAPAHTVEVAADYS